MGTCEYCNGDMTWNEAVGCHIVPAQYLYKEFGIRRPTSVVRLRTLMDLFALGHSTCNGTGPDAGKNPIGLYLLRGTNIQSTFSPSTFDTCIPWSRYETKEKIGSALLEPQRARKEKKDEKMKALHAWKAKIERRKEAREEDSEEDSIDSDY